MYEVVRGYFYSSTLTGINEKLKRNNIGKAYPTAINHLNIEIQKYIVETGGYKTKLDFHIILDETGKVIDILTTGRWNK